MNFICFCSIAEEHVCSYEFEENTTKPLEVTMNKNGTKKVYTKKSFAQSSNIFQSVGKLKVNSKLDTIKKSPKYSNVKVLNRKVSESSLSSSGQVKRGPGRPKKVLKCDDGNNNNGNNEQDIKEKQLKLDCSSKTKHKTSSSSSSYHHNVRTLQHQIHLCIHLHNTHLLLHAYDLLNLANFPMLVILKCLK